MSSRLLIILSIVLSISATYIYKHRDKISTPKNTFDARFDYAANGIKSIQTDTNGKVMLKITADTLKHNLTSDELTFTEVNVQQKQLNDMSLYFSADTVIWQRPTHKMLLSSNVNVIRQNTPVSDVTIDHDLYFKKADMKSMTGKQQKFFAKNISYNTSTKQMVSNHPISFQSGKSSINAQGVTADLETAQYDFKGIRAEYVQ